MVLTFHYSQNYDIRTDSFHPFIFFSKPDYVFQTWSTSSLLAGELKINRVTPPQTIYSTGTFFIKKRIEGVEFQ